MDKYVVIYSPVPVYEGGFAVGSSIGNKIDIEYAIKNEVLDIGLRIKNGKKKYEVCRRKRSKKMYLKKLN